MSDPNSYSHVAVFLFLKLTLTLVCLQLVEGRKETVMIRDPAWLKICNDKDILEVHTDTCTKGIWLNSSTQLGCVCVNGVWVLSNDYCDDDAIILVGKGHCFHISENVRSIKLLGRDNDPFYPSIYASPSSLDTFAEISETLSPMIETDATVVIGINPAYNVRRVDDFVCLKAVPVPGKPVYIYKNGRRVVNQWKIDSKDCHFPEDFTYKVAFGEMYKKYKVISGESTRGNCTIERCKTEEDKPAVLGRSLAGTSDIPKLTKDGRLHFGRSTFANPVKVSTPFQVKGPEAEAKLKCLQNRADVTQDPKQYEVETKEQTIRMMKAHLSLPLLEVPVIKPNLKELDYLHDLLLVILKSCPGGTNVYLKMISHGFLRMFYRLLHETQEQFTLRENTDEKQHGRIKDMLKFCYDDSDSMLSAGLMTDPVTSCNVSRKLIGGDHYYNETLKMNVSTEMPEHVRGNVNKHDMAIETVWKIVLGGYYRCAKSVTENATGPIYDHGDYSYMLTKLQSLFNPHIIKRWYSSHDAIKIYQFLFERVDLQNWMNELDECIAAMKNLSILKDMDWILRPKLPMSENDLSQKRLKRSAGVGLEKVWSGKGYCLNDFQDPIRKLNHKATGCPFNKLPA